ncbi:GTPase [Dactylosporangium sp. AC04546]|uniref:dynamin family protein n=1 Tax=Dactylosporangium sp. AC04546 TaxID=2862460 RepID=UPI001EDDCAAE|nr:dynamin family protein [Dactylosporangium sp. AC04546]WVK87009.1 GTPase [Dactylosporangium sp. AC04546]
MTDQIVATPLSDRLRDILVDVEPRLPEGQARQAVRAGLARLADPKLRIAVGGRLNAGKSTLVNALLGSQLAPTDATECTLLAAWFRYHHRNQVEVHFRDGTSTVIPAAPGGGVPARVPFDQHTVTHLTVWAPVEGVDHDFILIDTPGRDAVSGLDDYSMEAIRQADGLIFVMHDPGEVELRALEEFRGAVASARLSADNVIGVLSRIDTISDHLAPAEQRAEASKIAARAAARLRGLIGTILPVANRVAQAAGCGHLTESHAATIAALARLDEPQRRRLLFDNTRFLTSPAGTVSEAARADLLAMLGRYGVTEAIAAVDNGARGATAIRTALLSASGLIDLQELIRQRFLLRADALRVDSVLAGLRRVTGDAPIDSTLRGLADAINVLRRDPALRVAELAEVARAYAAGHLELTDRLAADLHDLLTGATPAQRLGRDAAATDDELRAEADRRIGRWQTFEFDLPRRSRRLARIVIELLNEVWFRLD